MTDALKTNAYYRKEMTGLLKDEFPVFEAAADRDQLKAIRVNTGKTSVGKLREAGIAIGETTPLNDDTYYLESEEKLGNHPFHLAGLYYLQEPSSSIVCDVLDVQENDVVLDLCAAPGGKSTQILNRLNRTGLLWTNEINRQRSQVLLSNLERWGYDNYILTSNSPDEMVSSLRESFDRILVDAPCSGASMFKKFPETINEYNEASVKACQRRQLEILDCAHEMLKDGGVLVYSTCTFNLIENELCMAEFINRHPDMTAVDCGIPWQRRGYDAAGQSGRLYRRVFPQDGGEGHFVAKLVKGGTNSKRELRRLPFSNNPVVSAFLKENGIKSGCTIIGNSVLLSDKPLINTDLRVIRQGIMLGTIEKNRIEPHHHFFVSIPAKDNFSSAYECTKAEITKFLQGESLAVTAPKGYIMINYQGYCVGFGKSDGRQIKNHLPKGLRVR